MKPKRIIHNIILVVGLAVLGVILWWSAKRMTPVVSERREHGNRPAPTAVVSSAPSAVRSSLIAPMATPRETEKSRERRRLRDEAVTRQQALAMAQQEALAGHPESDVAAALADFADFHEAALAEADAAQQRFLKPADLLSPPAPLPGAEADQARFAAVRQAILEEGMSLEQAETRYLRAASDP